MLLAATQSHVYLCDDAPKGLCPKGSATPFRDQRSAMMGRSTGNGTNLRDLARGDVSSMLHHKVRMVALFML